MKKMLLALFVACGISQFAAAQVLEDKVVILEAQRSALRLELNHNTKDVQGALNDRLSKQGLKAKTSKGFTTLTGAKLLEISPDLLDYYFKVEKLDKNRSALYLSISKGYSNFIDPANNAPIWDNAINFVGKMTYHTSNYLLANNAKNMEKELEKAQKDYDKSVKSLKKQEEALEKSRKDMEQTQKDIENKRNELEKTKRSLKN